jgi:hypothetical protein
MKKVVLLKDFAGKKKGETLLTDGTTARNLVNRKIASFAKVSKIKKD